MSLDFTSHLDYLFALLPQTILGLFALGILLGDVLRRGSKSGDSGPWTARAAALGVLIAIVADFWLLGVDTDGGMVTTDAFNVLANFVILIATLLTILYSSDYLEREGMRIGEFYTLLLLAAVGMMTLVAATDLVLLFVALELMSISVYVLTGFDRRNPRSAEAGLKYFLIGAFASAFLLYGIALLYGISGSTDLTAVRIGVEAASGSGSLLLVAGVALLIIGFAFKIAAVPFHMWAPDAYEGAPTLVTGFMAAGVKVAGVIALRRVLTGYLFPAEDVWVSVLWWLALLTMIVPNLVALAQDSVKRMLAYSSIAHAGYLLVGIVAAGPQARSATLFYLLVYAVTTVGAFGIVAWIAGKGDERARLSDYSGLGWRHPWIALTLTILLLSLAGFPPTAGFVGKLYLLQAAVGDDRFALAIALVLSSLVAYYYYLRVVWKMYFEESPEEAPVLTRPGSSFRVATVAVAAVVLLLGILPGPAIRRIDEASQELEREAAPVVSAVPASATDGAGEPSLTSLADVPDLVNVAGDIPDTP